MNSELKPKIRFKGFTDDWEQRELFDVADYRNGKAHENDIDDDGKYIVINSKFVSTEGKIKKYSNKQNEPLFQNEIVFVLSDVPNGRAIAKTFLVDKSRKYTLNQRIAGITPHSNINPKFLSITMNRNKYFLQFDDGVKQTNLSLNDMKKFEEFYPNKQEQNKIGELFTNLDNLITLHQRKCDKLVELKKSLLEKMFPQNNSVIPEIRFKGFTNDWEQRKLENVFNYERPDKYIVSSTEYLEFGPTPVLTANKAFILGYTTEKNKYVNSKESIIFDDFTLDAKFVDFPYMVKSSAIKILTLKDVTKDNIRFNFELLSNHKFNMLGHARHYISVVQPEEVFIPNKQEQDKIGELFSNLDNLITLHQCKYDKLNKIRQSLLNDMFI